MCPNVTSLQVAFTLQCAKGPIECCGMSECLLCGTINTVCVENITECDDT